MLTLLLGTDPIANRNAVLSMVAEDVAARRPGRVLLVPEMISHDTERRLCEFAGDTCSRYAEVLTFSRMAERVGGDSGNGVPGCLDNGGRIVAMASAARQLHGVLKSYAAVETKPEFLVQMIDGIDEFKRCCISPSDLKFASSATQGGLSQKLEELSLLYAAYDSVCERGRRDPRDQMTWLLEELESCSYAENRVFYIDGFPDFTRQHFLLISHLIRNAKQVVVSLACDRPDSRQVAFEKAGDTAQEILGIARQGNISYEIRQIPEEKIPLGNTAKLALSGGFSDREKAENLFVGQFDSMTEECLAVVERINSLIRSGARFRDITVACTDVSAYSAQLVTLLRRYRIPVYRSGSDSVLNKSAVYTVLCALDAALNGFEQRDVLRYFRSALSPVGQDDCDEAECYAIRWMISGNQWLTPWEYHPEGLNVKWTDEARDELAALEKIRSFAMRPLIALRDDFRNAENVAQQVQAVYRFMEEIRLSDRIDTLADTFVSTGRATDAQVLDQIWEILLNSLEQLYDVLGDTVWDGEVFCRLLRLLLSRYDVGTIPPSLDCLIFGSITSMRCQECKHLILIGGCEGAFPGYTGSVGVLNDSERSTLRSLGIPLVGGSVEGAQAELADIYGVLSGARETATVFCSGGEPSYIFKRLKKLAAHDLSGSIRNNGVLADETDMGAYLARYDRGDLAQKLGISDAYDLAVKRKHHELGKVAGESVKDLLGNKLYLYASSSDQYAKCRLSYFLNYGLKLKERKTAEIDPAQFGTFVHAVLENTGREVMDKGGFRKVSLEDTMKISEKYAQQYIQENFIQADSKRGQFFFRRNLRELDMIVEELWQELHDSQFVPVGFEVGFGDGKQLPGVMIPASMEAELIGYADRVDVWQTDERCFFRIVDYKTGSKDFDYCDVLNGIGMQMLIYLFALEDNGSELMGDHPIPAGVLYFPAHFEMMSADGELSEEEIIKKRGKNLRRKGLLLNSDDVLEAMEPLDNIRRLCCKRDKDGVIVGDVADRRQFSMLKSFLNRSLTETANGIASGDFPADPYTRGMNNNACAFCPYSGVCGESREKGRRSRQSIGRDDFWNEVEKAVTDHE